MKRQIRKKKRKSNDQLRDTTDNAFDPVVTGVTTAFFDILLDTTLIR
jgi:hypothetical protein